MPKFQVPIIRLESVTDHPNPKVERLSINKFRDYTLISNKLEDGNHRYRPGQLMAFVPVNACVPDSILKQRGYWDEANNRGILGGPAGNIVEPFLIKGVISEGLLFPTEQIEFGPGTESGASYIRNQYGELRLVKEGENVSGFLGTMQMTRAYMNGHQLSDPGMLYSVLDQPRPKYEIEDMKMYPNLLKGKQVVVTEMLHGILCVIGYDRTLGIGHEFFVADGEYHQVYNLNPNHNSIYARTAKPIWEEIKRYLKEMPAVEKFYLYGEIIGPKIQDLTYGLQSTEFRAIDVQIGMMGGGADSIPFGYIDATKKYDLFKWLNIATVPILYIGEFGADIMRGFNQTSSVIGGGIKKGVVITAQDESLVEGKRPILRLLSDKFLIRKNGTNWK